MGPETRSLDNNDRPNGYRKKMKMITFLWHAQKVKRRIKHLDDRSMRHRARAAHEYLLQSEVSAYKNIHEEHLKFLARWPHPTERQRRRPLNFIETPGIECAVWPHLYWKKAMCESYERYTDGRRVKRRSRQRRQADGDDSDTDTDDHNCSSATECSEDEDDTTEDVRHSMKRSFAAKLHSPLLGYGSTFKLAQYVYDLNLWSTLGSRKNLGLDVPMRVLMKGHTFSPMYWKEVHNALIDLVRQVGMPKLFFTWAPYEFSFKYHDWLRDQMQKELRSRVRLSAEETLHITHCMMETIRGLMSGSNHNRWTKFNQGLPRLRLHAAGVPRRLAQGRHQKVLWQRPASPARSLLRQRLRTVRAGKVHISNGAFARPASKPVRLRQ